MPRRTRLTKNAPSIDPTLGRQLQTIAKAISAPRFEVTPVGDLGTAEELAFALHRLEQAPEVVVKARDGIAARVAFQKAGAHVFRCASIPGEIMATRLDLVAKAEGVEVVPQLPDLSATTVDALGRALRLVKSETAPTPGDPSEERFVLGVVLEPDVIDSQNDTYDAPTIRKAAHAFMADYRNVGLQHSEIVNDKVQILESYIAPADFTMGDVVVKSGAWLMGMRVVDDAMWAAVKAGDITGFSIGGSAFRSPEPDTSALASA